MAKFQRMMKLTFSVEDILSNEQTKSEAYEKDSKRGGNTVDQPALEESNRSQSPDSTTSLDSFEKRNMRRGRTAILDWQRMGLESAFRNHRYPTVQNLERISNELCLPHSVTKVWFQNRRSKLRKDGNSYQEQQKTTGSCLENRPIIANLTARPIPVVELERKPGEASNNEMGARIVAQEILQRVQQCTCSECMNFEQLRLEPRPEDQRLEHHLRDMPVLIRQKTPELHPGMYRLPEKSVACNCRTCRLKSESEAKMRVANGKPRFGDDIMFSPEVQHASGMMLNEIQQSLRREFTGLSYPGAPRDVILSHSTKICSCSNCRYGTSYFKY